MKKLIFLLLAIGFALTAKSQEYWKWDGPTLNMANVHVADTVLQNFRPTTAEPNVDISSTRWTCEVDAQYLNKPIRIAFGGDIDFINLTQHVWGFKAYPGDSASYFINKASLKDTIRSCGYTVITYTKTFTGTVPAGFKCPAYRVFKIYSGTTGLLPVKCKFSKP